MWNTEGAMRVCKHEAVIVRISKALEAHCSCNDMEWRYGDIERLRCTVCVKMYKNGNIETLEI